MKLANWLIESTILLNSNTVQEVFGPAVIHAQVDTNARFALPAGYSAV